MSRKGLGSTAFPALALTPGTRRAVQVSVFVCITLLNSPWSFSVLGFWLNHLEVLLQVQLITKLMHSADHIGSAFRSFSLSKYKERRDEQLNYLQGAFLAAESLDNDLL